MHLHFLINHLNQSYDTSNWFSVWKQHCADGYIQFLVSIVKAKLTYLPE